MEYLLSRFLVDWTISVSTLFNNLFYLSIVYLQYCAHFYCTAKWFSYTWSEVAQLCMTLCDPMDYSLPGSSVHGIFQARVLEWVAISFSRGSSQPRDWTQVSLIVSRRFTVWATREVKSDCSHGYDVHGKATISRHFWENILGGYVLRTFYVALCFTYK